MRNYRKINNEIKNSFFKVFFNKQPKRILFDHLPKCGGSSINVYLEENFLRRNIYSLNVRDLNKSIEVFKSYNAKKRFSYRLIKGHLAHTLIEFAHPNTIKATVLREPVDRLVSHYYYVKNNPTHYLYAKVQKSNMTLESYIKSGISEELSNWYITHFSGLTLKEVNQKPNKAIDIALNTVLNTYDVIGFLDDLNSFTDRLYHKADLRTKYKGNRVNITKVRPKIESISKDSIEVIEKYNTPDIIFYKKLKSLTDKR